MIASKAMVESSVGHLTCVKVNSILCLNLQKKSVGKFHGRRFGSENGEQGTENERSGKKQRVEGNAPAARSPLQEQEGNAMPEDESTRWQFPDAP